MSRIFCRERKTRALIRLRSHAGWSAPSLFPYNKSGFLSSEAKLLNIMMLNKLLDVFFDISLTVKVAPHEYVIRHFSVTADLTICKM